MLGNLLIGVSTFHLLSHAHQPHLALNAFALPALVTVSLFYAGHRLNRESVSFGTAVRVFMVTVGVGIVAVATAAVEIAIIQSGGYVVPEAHGFLQMSLAAGFAGGAPLGYYYYNLKWRNRELSRRVEEIDTLNERLSITHRVLRHNLRNELAITLGLTGFLLETREYDPDVVKKLHSHQERLVTLAATANAIQNVWNIDRVVHQDLVKTVREATEMFREEEEEEVTISTKFPEQTTVLAHPMLVKAICELFVNTARHGGEEVDCRISETEGPEGYTRLRVADNGPGIPYQEIRALQESEETALEHGTGLGLRLVEAVVKQSEGRLSFDSDELHGTIVKVDLPKSTERRSSGSGDAL